MAATAEFRQRAKIAFADQSVADELTDKLDLVQVLKRGTTYYVDTNTGSDSRDGKSWAQAFLTMANSSKPSLDGFGEPKSA